MSCSESIRETVSARDTRCQVRRDVFFSGFSETQDFRKILLIESVKSDPATGCQRLLHPCNTFFKRLAERISSSPATSGTFPMATALLPTKQRNGPVGEVPLVFLNF
jgi:hypothetical protein